MKNEKTSLNIRELKKQVKGITLIALVVTIIILLILVGGSEETGVEISEDEKDVTREPDVLSDYDTEERHYKDILGFDSTKAMAESFVVEYKAMSDSIKKYHGFYIGRYELTESAESPTEKAGASLTNINWYNLYKACQNVVTGKENVKSTMIYGVQWDAVCDWLEQSGFDTDSKYNVVNFG